MVGDLLMVMAIVLLLGVGKQVVQQYQILMELSQHQYLQIKMQDFQSFHIQEQERMGLLGMD